MSSFGQMLYAGDNLSGEAWDGRGWARHDTGRDLLLRPAIYTGEALEVTRRIVGADHATYGAGRDARPAGDAIARCRGDGMSESEPTWVPWPPPRARCAEGAGRSIPDLIADGLRVLLVGINPGLCSGATGYHFATPGNRFWSTMHRAGWTERQLRPDEPAALLALGIGITNLVDRATASADEVSGDELRAGAEELRRKVERHRPRAVAILGISAYRSAFDEADARVGRQSTRLGGVPVWVLPNPSGLNAHYGPAKLVEHFAAFREATA